MKGLQIFFLIALNLECIKSFTFRSFFRKPLISNLKRDAFVKLYSEVPNSEGSDSSDVVEKNKPNSSNVKSEPSESTFDDDIVDDGNYVDNDDEIANENYDDEVNENDISEDFDKNMTSSEVNTTEEIDPQKELKEKKEKELNELIQQLEETLFNERKALLNIKDTISTSGKSGFFLVQAQVAEFLKTKDAEQKRRVSRNKEEFITELLPVLDSLRDAPSQVPSVTEKEMTMHKTFGSLLNSFLNVMNKFGIVELNAELGKKYSDSEHEVYATEDAEDGIILRQVRAGLIFKEGGKIIRKTSVVIGKKNKSDSQDKRIEKDVPMSLSEGEIEQCKLVFSEIDTNNDGLINQEEIAAILQSLELTPDTDDLERMMQEADLNNDGVIDFNEFLRVVSKVKSSETN